MHCGIVGLRKRAPLTDVNPGVAAAEILATMKGLMALTGLVLLVALAAARAAPLAADFGREVDRRLDLPPSAQAFYGVRMAQAIEPTAARDARSQFFVLVDRSPRVQAVMIFWRRADGAFELVGAAPATTGKPGKYEYFATPLGVFEHSAANPDFRAEGTENRLGIRGYGEKGMRVYDFGWVRAERGWDPGHFSSMRLQMHATDPEHLEPLLGRAGSKGCIRIPASLNVFIDRHGLLDAAAEHAWLYRSDRQPTPYPGRWLVVVDTQRTARPAWTLAVDRDQ